MEACNACEGNVSHGKTCHRCGRKGPLGQGWQMRAIDLEVETSTLRARVAELETSLDEAVNVEGGLYDKIEHSLLTALGFPGTIDEAIAETKRLRDLVKEVEKIVGESPSPRDVRIALGKLPAPLRLGRGPTGDEVKQHGVGVGLWLVHFAGDAPDRWHVVCFRAIDDEDARPTDFEIDEVGWTDIAVDYDDAIPLDSNRQPCPVGGGRGTL